MEEDSMMNYEYQYSCEGSSLLIRYKQYMQSKEIPIITIITKGTDGDTNEESEILLCEDELRFLKSILQLI